MSSQDTDIIEVALETLVVLERLQHLLASRDHALRLYQARLYWEHSRRDCCMAFESLYDAIESQVSRYSQWSLGSSPDKGAIEDLVTEAQAFSDNVARSSEALDVIIEQRQAPDEYLDEQDRIENLAGIITSRTDFVREVVNQWSAAAQIHSRLNALHNDAKALVGTAGEAIRQPHVGRADQFEASASSLTTRLESLAGPASVQRFLQEQTRPATSLRLAESQSLPLPRHADWPEQDLSNGHILSTLHRELASVAKRTKLALEVVGNFRRAHDLYHSVRTLADALSVKARDCRQASAGLKALWSCGHEDASWPKVVTDIFALGLSGLVNTRDRTTKACGRLRDLQLLLSGGAETCAALQMASLQCRTLGVASPALRGAEDELARWSAQQSAADSDIEQSEQLCQMLQVLSQAEEKHERFRILLSEAVSEQVQIQASIAFDQSKAELFDEYANCLKQIARISIPSIDEIKASASPVRNIPLVRDSAQNVRQLNDGQEHLLKSYEEMERLTRWTQRLREQTQSVCVMHTRFTRLEEQSQQMYRHPAEESTDVVDIMQNFEADVNNFIEDQETDIFLIGSPPTLHLLGISPPCPDVSVKEQSTTWCLALARSLTKAHSQLHLVASDGDETNSAAPETEQPASPTDSPAATTSSRTNTAAALQRSSTPARVSPAPITAGTLQAAQYAVHKAKEACQFEIHRRERSFERVLRSVSARRLPVKAFLAELSNRRFEAHEAINTRLGVLRGCVDELCSGHETSTPIPEPIAEAHEAVQQCADAAEALMKRLDQHIHREGGVPSGATSFLESVKAFDCTISSAADSLRSSVDSGGVDTIATQRCQELLRRLNQDEITSQVRLAALSHAKRAMELPSADRASALEQDCAQLSADVRCLCLEHSREAEMYQLEQALSRHLADVARYTQLASFGGQVIVADEALAALLNFLDQPPATSGDPHPDSNTQRPAASSLAQVEALLSEKMSSVERAMEHCTSVAQNVLDDVRVRERLMQLQRFWIDLAEMSKDITQPEGDRSTSVMSQSTTTSSLSLASSASAQSITASDTSLSRAVPASESTPSKIPVRRAPSDSMGTPPRQRTQSLKARPPARTAPQTPKAEPKGRSGSTSSVLVTPLASSSRRQRLASIAQSPVTTPQRVQRSTLNDNVQGTPLPASRLPRQSLTTPTSARSRELNMLSPRQMGRPNRYRANPRSRLDMAIGKLVNRMPMPVSVVHASSLSAGSSSSRNSSDWKDDSGRYWVGHPDPKLCFCRILRSRTIMVRVGGGWQELTRYLLQHCALDSSGIEGIEQDLEDSTHLQSLQGVTTPHRRRRSSAAASTCSSPVSLRRDAHRIVSNASTSSHFSSRAARSPSLTATSCVSGGISSPIIFGPDGSPEQTKDSPRSSSLSLRQRKISQQSPLPPQRHRSGATPPPSSPKFPQDYSVSFEGPSNASTSPVQMASFDVADTNKQSAKQAFLLKAPSSDIRSSRRGSNASIGDSYSSPTKGARTVDAAL